MILFLDDTRFLGNHIATYIHIIACGIDSGTTVTNLGLGEYASFFAGTRNDLFARYPARQSLLRPTPTRRRRAAHWVYRLTHSLESGKLHALGHSYVRTVHSGTETTMGKDSTEKREMIVDMDSAEFRRALQATPALVLQGPLFRAQTSIRKHYAGVKAFLRPADAHLQNINAALAEARRDSDLLIGVHIRRADYASFMGGKYMYSWDQYAQVMTWASALFSGKQVAFLVHTDTPLEPNRFQQFRYTVAHGKLLEDVYALAGCDYLLGPPSTYMSWASFYGHVPHYKIMDPAHPPTPDDFVINRG